MAKQNAAADSELDLKRKARRRLVGSIAFFLIVVATVPMILDSEPKPSTAQDVDLQIPNQDKVAPFVAGSEAASAVPAVASGQISGGRLQIDEAPPTEMELIDQGAAMLDEVLDTVGSVPPAVEPKPESVKPVAPPPPVAKPPKPEMTTDSIARLVEESMEPPAKPAPKVVEKPEKTDVAPKEGFVAQIGAYSRADTARQEVDKLAGLGFKAYTEKVNNMVRVRVGPFSDREQAERAVQRLQDQGVHSVVMGVK